MIEDIALGSQQDEAAARAALPHPLHIFERLTGSRHYHFGLGFDLGPAGSDSGALARAMDRLSWRCLDFLPREGSVLDIGCGMGGTTSLLAERGLDVVGVDPCELSIAYARSARPPRRPRFVCCRLGELRRRLPEERFDALVSIETSHRFACLQELVSTARELLRPGGTLVSLDVAVRAAPEVGSIPFHERGTLAGVGRSMGFVVRHHEELTSGVVPSLERLAQRLGGERRALIAEFEASHPRIAHEIGELQNQLELLAHGFAHGHLVYELTVLRSDPRLPGTTGR